MKKETVDKHQRLGFSFIISYQRRLQESEVRLLLPLCYCILISTFFCLIRTVFGTIYLLALRVTCCPNWAKLRSSTYLVSSRHLLVFSFLFFLLISIHHGVPR